MPILGWAAIAIGVLCAAWWLFSSALTSTGAPKTTPKFIVVGLILVAGGVLILAFA